MDKKKVKGTIMAIDLGNYNTNAVTTKRKEFSFESKYEIGTDSDVIDSQTIELDGVYYRIECGEFDLEFNKASKNYMPKLLYAIANTSDDEEANLVLNVPIDNMGTRDKFKAELENHEFPYKYKGEKRTIKINNVAVVAEGMGSIYSLPPTAKDQSIILFDIGGRTTNVITMVKGKIEKKFTINKGIMNFYSDVAKRLNSQGENYDLEEMGRLIRENLVTDIEEDKEIFIKEILNKVKEKIRVSTYKKYFSGGGSAELSSKIKSMFDDEPCLIKDPVWANVRGNLQIALNVWEEE